MFHVEHTGGGAHARTSAGQGRVLVGRYHRVTLDSEWRGRSAGGVLSGGAPPGAEFAEKASHAPASLSSRDALRRSTWNNEPH